MLTRRDCLEQVIDGIDAAINAGLSPVKVNAVLVRGVNDDEIVDFATFGRERGVSVRFIEFGTEEIGLIGAYRWVAAHHDELGQIRFMLNMDAAGGHGRKGQPRTSGNQRRRLADKGPPQPLRETPKKGRGP